MAKVNFEFNMEPRDTLGKGASRRLRRLDDKVPAVMYGGEDTDTPQSISLIHREVLKALEHDAVYSHILMLNHNGTTQKVVLKDIQRHPYKPRILHMDFLRVSENKPINMHVPLHFLGQDKAPGVVNEGGIITHHMVEIEIKCLPRYLPEFIAIDLTDAPIDTVIHLSQLKLPEHVETVAVVHSKEDDMPVVSIHKPRRAIVEEAPAAEAAPAKGAKGGKGAAPAKAAAAPAAKKDAKKK